MVGACTGAGELVGSSAAIANEPARSENAKIDNRFAARLRLIGKSALISVIR